MPTNLLRGSTQIMAGTISVDRMVAGWDSPFLLKNGTVALTGNMSLGGFLLTSAGDAVSAQDVVNLRTMLSYINGIAVKPTVRGVLVANNAITGALTSDGVTYVTNDIVLLTAQSTGSQNGPWVVNTAGAWTRPSWWAAASTQKPSLFYVSEGTTYYDTKWTTITDGTITVDTTSLSITQDLSGSTYTNGNGISLTGNVFAVKVGNGVQFDGSFNVQAKPYATRLITVDANGIGVTDSDVAGKIVVANASLNASWAAMSGDVTINGTGVTTINRTAGTGFLKYGDYVVNETPTGSINSSNATFTLAGTPQNSTLALYLNTARLRPGAGNDYTISGSTITMLIIPSTGDTLTADYMK